MNLADKRLKLEEIAEEVAELEVIMQNKVKSNVMDYAGLNKADHSVQLFARKINMQNEFNQVCKYAENPIISEDFSSNPVMRYYKESQRSNALPLPVLSRITNKILPLVNYGLSDGPAGKGICTGLAQAMEGNPKLLTGIILDNNGIRDEHFATILQGLQKLDNIKIIVYRNNCLQQQSIE